MTQSLRLLWLDYCEARTKYPPGDRERVRLLREWKDAAMFIGEGESIGKDYTGVNYEYVLDNGDIYRTDRPV